MQTPSTNLSEKAIFLRCKRALKRKDGVVLHQCHPRSREYGELGRYYGTDMHNIITIRGLHSLDGLARELGVLRLVADSI